MSRVAIVIVTHNSAAEIGRCLDALLQGPEPSTQPNNAAEIVVVDNASADRTIEEVALRGVRLVANSTNAGFAAAVNTGVRATTAPLILLLNPDAHVIRGLDVLAARFDDPEVGAAGGMLVGSDGLPQAGFMARNLPGPATLAAEVLGVNRLWPSNPLNWHYRCRAFDPMTAAQVEQPAGAFLMFPRAVWHLLGGFDERFWPIWFEDVDFCARIKASNLKIWYEPHAVASHTGGHSINSLSSARRQRYWYGSLLEYSAKHHSPSGFRGVCAAVMLGAFARALRGFTAEGTIVWSSYSRVAGVAWSWFFRGRARKSNGVGVG